MNAPRPYRSTPVFSAETLPAALRKDHCTKAGTWGLLEVIAGTLNYTVSETGVTTTLKVGETMVIEPQQMHFVEPLCGMEMQVHFYHERPA